MRFLRPTTKSQGRFGKQDFIYVPEKDVAIAMHDWAGAADPTLGT
jgi:hypothetical protein